MLRDGAPGSRPSKGRPRRSCYNFRADDECSCSTLSYQFCQVVAFSSSTVPQWPAMHGVSRTGETLGDVAHFHGCAPEPVDKKETLRPSGKAKTSIVVDMHLVSREEKAGGPEQWCARLISPFT